MKNTSHWLAAALLLSPCDAAQIAREPFDYAPASSLSTQGGGGGWLGDWYQDGESVVTGSAGMGFTDSLGNVLSTSGLSADTTGSATTRSFREFDSGLLNDVWISFLYRLPSTNNKYEGVNFYRGIQPVFSISNPSSTTSAAIFLANNLVAGAGVNTGRGTFTQTHLIVLKLTKGGGAGGADQVEVFIDPTLSGNPSSSNAIVMGTDFDFDRVRIAGQDGSTLLVDELRIGESFADVTPHATAGALDSDGDGLSDEQEAVLGLDPNVSDENLITGIQAHPGWFDLHSASEVMDLGNGGVVLQKTANNPLDLFFEVQHSGNLTHWSALETINRIIDLPTGKNFLRVTLQDP